jgi:hypothetical protein
MNEALLLCFADSQHSRARLETRLFSFCNDLPARFFNRF